MRLGGVNHLENPTVTGPDFQSLKIEYKLKRGKKEGHKLIEAKTERGEAEGPGQRPGPSLPK